MTDNPDRRGERMTSKDRREILTFVAFLALLATAIAVVIIVRQDWSPERWAAIESAAVLAQTFLLLGALVYAGHEVAAAWRVAERERRRQLLDRLEVAVYDALPMLRRYASGLRSIARAREMAADQPLADVPEDDPTRRSMLEWLRAADTRALDDVFEARTLAGEHIMRVKRAMAALGRPGFLLPYQLELELIRWSRSMFTHPALSQDISADDLVASADEVDRHATRLVREVERWVVEMAPADGQRADRWS